MTKTLRIIKEAINRNANKNSHGDDLYYKTYSDAIKTALDSVKKRGFEVDPDEYQTKVAGGQRKPSEGKTVSHSIRLMKNGKPIKKTVEIQVYNRSNSSPKPYELNHYIGESMEVNEGVGSDLGAGLRNWLDKKVENRGKKKNEGYPRKVTFKHKERVGGKKSVKESSLYEESTKSVKIKNLENRADVDSVLQGFPHDVGNDRETITMKPENLTKFLSKLADKKIKI